MKITLKLLAPYIAVLLFWCVFSNAWLAIVAYHVQILFWSRSELRNMRKPYRKISLLFSLPAALAGPLLYFLLPIITRTELSQWLISHHLSGLSLLLMIPYFGFIHPVLEQIHWSKLREETAWSHLFFAGYHMLVLCSLLTFHWLLFCFAVLVIASIWWKLIVRMTNSLIVPTVSHVLADFGIVLVAWAKTQ